MASTSDCITHEQANLIRRAKLFFVASAAPDLSPGPLGQGPVNLSPKGGAPLHIIDDRTVAYLDFRGSGNETARHAQHNGPLTPHGHVTRCARRRHRPPLRPRPRHPLDQSPHAEQLRADAPGVPGLPERQVVTLRIDSTATSCGYGVPVYEYAGDRDQAARGRRYKQ